VVFWRILTKPSSFAILDMRPVVRLECKRLSGSLSIALGEPQLTATAGFLMSFLYGGRIIGLEI
jgi:hypothetical protein